MRGVAAGRVIVTNRVEEIGVGSFMYYVRLPPSPVWQGQHCGYRRIASCGMEFLLALAVSRDQWPRGRRRP